MEPSGSVTTSGGQVPAPVQRVQYDRSDCQERRAPPTEGAPDSPRHGKGRGCPIALQLAQVHRRDHAAREVLATDGVRGGVLLGLVVLLLGLLAGCSAVEKGRDILGDVEGYAQQVELLRGAVTALQSTYVENVTELETTKKAAASAVLVANSTKESLARAESDANSALNVARDARKTAKEAAQDIEKKWTSQSAMRETVNTLDNDVTGLRTKAESAEKTANAAGTRISDFESWLRNMDEVVKSDKAELGALREKIDAFIDELAKEPEIEAAMLKSGLDAEKMKTMGWAALLAALVKIGLVAKVITAQPNGKAGK